MNEQFRERLVKQAGFHIRPSIENTVPGINWNCGSYGYDQCVDRLIALVAKECADLCDQFQARDVGMQPAECAGAIRRMFGIKE